VNLLVGDVFGNLDPNGYIAIVALFVLLSFVANFLLGQLFFLHLFLSNKNNPKNLNYF
jgi:hypothetical protein